MNPTAILWPMIAHAMLVFIVYATLGIRRRSAVAHGEAKVRRFRLRGDEPASTAVVSNNLMNQFEAPVLFHAVCICLFVTAGVSILTVTLAWLFVLSRYLHAFVHLTGNNVTLRFIAFGFGVVALFIFWAVFALHLAGL